MSALHLATEYNNLKITKLLLKNLADPNLRDKIGNSPYGIAFRVKAEAYLKILNFLMNIMPTRFNDSRYDVHHQDKDQVGRRAP